jgi:hypothetical protein
MITDDDAPRSLRDAGVRERRRLDLPRLARLTAYVAKLRERGLGEVPDFDPLDGGVDARMLFLFEKPGPMTPDGARGRRPGSGFISRNNDDPTAAAIFDFMQKAGIPRKLTVIWNVIPWWNSARKVTKEEKLNGAKSVQELINLLPNLRAVVMVGKNADDVARPYLRTTGLWLSLFRSYHPGPLVRARWPDKWKAIPSEWAKAYCFVRSIDGTEVE